MDPVGGWDGAGVWATETAVVVAKATAAIIVRVVFIAHPTVKIAKSSGKSEPYEFVTSIPWRRVMATTGLSIHEFFRYIRA